MYHTEKNETLPSSESVEIIYKTLSLPKGDYFIQISAQQIRNVTINIRQYFGAYIYGHNRDKNIIADTLLSQQNFFIQSSGIISSDTDFDLNIYYYTKTDFAFNYKIFKIR